MADDYLPLLAALYEDMLDRNLAGAVQATFDAGAASVYNDVLRVGAGGASSPADIARVKARLEQCGYEAWRNEN